MARRKGKSQKRIKDWRPRTAGQPDVEDLASRGRRLLERAVKLPAGRLEAPAELVAKSLDDLPRREGLVLGVFRRGAIVRFRPGQEAFCGIAKTYRAPPGSTALTVGDIVTVALTPERHVGGRLDLDGERQEGLIIARRPRQTVLARPQPTSAKRLDRYGDSLKTERVIAANMDILLVVASTCQPPINPRLIERFLIVAQRGELRTVLVVNKIDLAGLDEDLAAYFRRLEIDVVPCSAVTGEGLEALRGILAGRRSVLAGASGVGKSTLVNALVPGAEAATRAIRQKDQRGRHTTAAAAVYDLPPPGLPAPSACAGSPRHVAGPSWAPAGRAERPPPPAPLSGTEGLAPAPLGQPALSEAASFAGGPGGIIVDTPGIRELGFRIEPQELPWYFPEFEPLAGKCRFGDCTHSHEPACAVIAAVQAGQIPARRYESYLHILRSLD